MARRRYSPRRADLPVRAPVSPLYGQRLGVYRSFHRVPTLRSRRRRKMMKGYVAQRRGRFYAVIYAGLDPGTGRERRTWHPAGTDRAAAERLAARLAIEEQGRADQVRALTFGAYLTGQWLPGKKL